MKHANSKVIYAGSFDPLTFGHLWIIKTAAQMFDELLIAVGHNPLKKFTFTIEERVLMVSEATHHLGNCQVYALPPILYLVDYAKMQNAQYLVRGLRSTDDFNYEYTICNFNREKVSDIVTLFLMPPPDISGISSSMVKALIGPESWQDVVSKYVPENVLKALKEKYYENS